MTDGATLIGSAQAATMLGIDKSTLTRWIIAGKLVATKLPGDKGAYVIELAEVERMAKGECPRGGAHQWRLTSEKDGVITHTCSKCGESVTRRQEKAAS